MNGHCIGHRADTAEKLLSDNRHDPHSGLVFERFLAMWDGPADDPSTVKPLNDPLNWFVRQFRQRGGRASNRALLEDYHRRLDAAFEPRQAVLADYRVQWRFVTGLGANHPTDNGFSFDPLIGVPYLTGSAVKGLCRRAAEFLDADPSKRDRLLGPQEETHHACGDLLLFDAMPVTWPRLTVDVINCHHPRYYRELFGADAGKADQRKKLPVPTETEDPVPVYFLVVDTGSEFRFRIASHSGDRDGIQTAFEWLEAGLDWLGAGAKTAVGYGAMELMTKR